MIRSRRQAFEFSLPARASGISDGKLCPSKVLHTTFQNKAHAGYNTRHVCDAPQNQQHETWKQPAVEAWTQSPWRPLWGRGDGGEGRQEIVGTMPGLGLPQYSFHLVTCNSPPIPSLGRGLAIVCGHMQGIPPKICQATGWANNV